MDVPRRREYPEGDAFKRLRIAAATRAKADKDLRAAVRAAREAGGSIRVIADESGLSTRTVQDWLKD